jgi:hypothetical protein
LFEPSCPLSVVEMHSSNEIIGERGLTSIITVFSRGKKCRYVERGKETLKNAKCLLQHIYTLRDEALEKRNKRLAA